MTKSVGGPGKETEGTVDENFENYGYFLIQKRPKWKKVPDDKDILGYRQVQIMDIMDPVYDALREKIPYNPDTNYETATWSDE